MAWGQPAWFQTRVDYLPIGNFPQSPANNIVTGVVPVTAVTGLPIGASGVPGTQICHVTVTLATGPATIQFAHGLLYTPTMIWVWPRGAEGVTPTIEVGACYADTNSGNVAIGVSAAGTFDVYYC